eukprot:6137045-Prymnesium_polylepis.1
MRRHTADTAQNNRASPRFSQAATAVPAIDVCRPAEAHRSAQPHTTLSPQPTLPPGQRDLNSRLDRLWPQQLLFERAEALPRATPGAASAAAPQALAPHPTGERHE